MSSKDGKDFHDFAKFKNDLIDLKLMGSGQYFKYIEAFSDKFVDELLNKYFNFDRIISNENDTTLLDNF